MISKQTHKAKCGDSGNWDSGMLALIKFGFSRSAKQSVSWRIAATVMGRCSSSKLSVEISRVADVPGSIAAWPTKCGI